MDTLILFLVTALVNALWQPALIAGIAWLALNVSHCSNATTRHVVWTLALVASVVVPLISAVPVALPAQATIVASSVRPVLAFPARQDATKAAISTTPGHTSQPLPALSRPKFHVRPAIATIASILWLIVALGILVRLLVSFFYLERLKRDALPLAVDSRPALTRYDRAEKGARDVRVCVSGEINVPVAVGIFDAMILLPSDLVDELDASDLDRVLLHELAHVRRSDDWVNLFERISQALFFFSPGIYWITRQMDLEREVACDDWVLEQSAENVPYARCLARIVELTRWPYAAPAAPGVFVTRKSMSIRIERLLAHGRDIRLRLTLVPTVLSLTLIAAIVVAGGFISPTLAYSIDRGDMPTGAKAQTHRAARVRIAQLNPPREVAVATEPPALAKPAATIAAATPKAKAAVTVATGFVSVSKSGSSPGSASTSKSLVADESYLDDLAAVGYRNLTIDEVIELKSVGVDRDYIEGLQRVGYGNLPPRELVELKSLGVNSGYISGLAAAGLTGLRASELVELKSLGVDGVYIRNLADSGYSHLTVHQYVQLKSLGVDGDYIHKLASHGFAQLTVEQLIQYKSLGISPK